MNTINETKVALYYRIPYQEERDLVCICESEQVVAEQIKYLREEWPHLYQSPERFEIDLVTYVRRAY